MSDVLLKHLDALSASLTLMQGQIEAARHAVTLSMPPAQTPTMTPVKVGRCEGVRDEFCALMNDDARIPKGSFADPNAATCKGCGARVDLAPAA